MSPQQKALVVEAKFGPHVLKDIDVPKPGANEVLVRIEATALNPADWKILYLGILAEVYPTILGFDAAGVVVEVGEAVKEYAVGDKVIAQGWYDPVKHSMHGTFQQFMAFPLDTVLKMPSNLTFEEAATIPSGLVTAAFPLYNQVEEAPSAKLTAPWEEGGRGKYASKPIFVLGGSSSIGQYVIQLARLSGFAPIITTASLHNADLLKSLGATHVIDRTLAPETVAQQAREIAGGPIDLVYDAISVADTLAAGYQATSSQGDFVVVLPDPIPGAEANSQKKVYLAHGLFHTPINHAIGKSLLVKLPELLEKGDIKPNRYELLPGGLRGVDAGLLRLRNNQVSAAKLVVRPQETSA
ncbi:GroES-like protein [Cubamyces sp. BRFM 1775]|nr:GroES-like protein [Cubamyces sp. BRFM 1775]